MMTTALPRLPRLRLACAAVTAALMTGCLSYGPAQYSAMTPYRLCELRQYQTQNLTANARTALDAELKRRNEDCRALAPQIARDHADDEYDRMYNRQSP